MSRTAPEDYPVSRRRLLALAAGTGASILCPAAAFAKDDFWKQKDPSQWTAEEKNEMLTKSPWAKQVETESQRQGSPGGGRRRMGGMGIPGLGGGYPGGGGGYPGGGGGYPGGGGGYPGGGGGYPGGGGGGYGQQMRYNVTVRWESALPVRAALEQPPQEASTGNYVISVTGLPDHMPRMRRSDSDDQSQDDDSDQDRAKRLEDLADRLKETTELEPKGMAPLHPSKVVPQNSTASTSFLFIFDKNEGAITEDHKEVTFTTHMGPLEVKTKFNLKDMKYKGGLAV